MSLAASLHGAWADGMTGTITSSGTYSTYTLSAPLTNGSSIEFLNNDNSVAGVLILNDNAQASAFEVTTTTVAGNMYASATIGGSVLDFEPGRYGLIGDQITIQVLSNLFDTLDMAATAAADNADFADKTETAVKNGSQFLLLPGGTVKATPESGLTLDANESSIVNQIALAVLGTAPAQDGATLDLGFALRTDPNSNNPFVDGVLTTQQTVNPCFAAGTRILTVQGEVPVEQLVAGDVVITASGAEAPIVWVGRREVDLASHPRPLSVRPVIIEPGALGEGVPARRLCLSPDHALWLDEVLVPAKALLNWTSIRQDLAASRVVYHHVELPTHNVIFAEGCAAESFLDTGHKGVFAGEAIALHPAMQALRTAESFAPLCESGPKLAAIRAGIAARRRQNGLMGARE
jgi:hypothetical protein